MAAGLATLIGAGWFVNEHRVELSALINGQLLQGASVQTADYVQRYLPAVAVPVAAVVGFITYGLAAMATKPTDRKEMRTYDTYQLICKTLRDELEQQSKQQTPD